MMRGNDDSLRDQVRRSWRRNAGGRVPPFDRVMLSAEVTRGATVRRRRWLAAAGALLVVTVIGTYLQAPRQETHYIEVAELLDSTYWTAPSDVLLPQKEFDIYQDMPVLFESTEPVEGALL